MLRSDEKSCSEVTVRDLVLRPSISASSNDIVLSRFLMLNRPCAPAMDSCRCELLVCVDGPVFDRLS